jgi:hypothetical protein
VITREQAETIASQIVGGNQQDGSQTWELVEFDAGWLIREAWLSDRSRRGGAVRVVERSGRVMRFPSSVPPDRILEEYADVVEDGFPEDQI